jgi:hypothetical protein
MGRILLLLRYWPVGSDSENVKWRKNSRLLRLRQFMIVESTYLRD